LAEVIELAPLSDEDIRRLVSDIMQRVESPPESLFTLVCERALGNPLIVEEIVRILIADEVIDTRHQPWALHLDKLAEVTLPSEFEGVVKARLDKLSSEERESLEIAAVIGQTFWLGAVLALYRGEPNGASSDENEWQLDPRSARLADLFEALRRKDMIRPHADSLFK